MVSSSVSALPGCRPPDSSVMRSTGRPASMRSPVHYLQPRSYVAGYPLLTSLPSSGLVQQLEPVVVLARDGIKINRITPESFPLSLGQSPELLDGSLGAEV